MTEENESLINEHDLLMLAAILLDGHSGELRLSREEVEKWSTRLPTEISYYDDRLTGERVIKVDYNDFHPRPGIGE